VGQTKLFGHRSTYEEANGDDRRGVSHGHDGFHRSGKSREEAVPGLVQYDPHVEQPAHGLEVWMKPFVTLRAPKLFNLRSDPFEAEYEAVDYVKWFVEHPGEASSYFQMRSEFRVGFQPWTIVTGRAPCRVP
jgi:hypothetical protein